MIDNDKFQWSKTILMDDDALARAHQVGINLANAAKDIPNATWQGPAGVCPHCHTNNFYIEPGTTHAICGLCGPARVCGNETETIFINQYQRRILFPLPERRKHYAET